MISFSVPGDPVAKARARVTQWGAYTPLTTVRAEHGIAAMARRAMRDMLPYDEPITLDIVAIFTAPKRSLKAQALPNAAFKMTKPDIDNLAKTVLDACNGIVWRDDSRVAVLNITKIYGTTPRLDVAVRPVDIRAWPFQADARGNLRQFA
jgi:Holliday junction resolvase RusA-like endonuclease